MTALPLSTSLVNLGKRVGLSRKLVIDYSALLTGQIGRLIFSLVYFVTLTRALSLGDFGVFASASAIGIVLSRVAGLGFISPLYRVATTRPLLIGVYSAGYLVALLLSMPLVLILVLGIHAALYPEFIALGAFALIVLAEVLCWRSLEVVIIVNNGLNRFMTGSLLAVSGVAAKSVAALWFWYDGSSDLASWALVYFATNACVAALAIACFYPRQALRWKPSAWLGRARDALGVSAAEALFYVQAELDKVLVLSLGGEIVAGLYAIIMRLVDLTAMPVRAFNTMLTQWIMRSRQSKRKVEHRLVVDIAIASLSAAALLGVAFLLWFLPGVAGRNIALAATFLPAMLLVPAFRNAIEYHTDLLYGHERMAVRVVLLMYLTVLKAALLTALLGMTDNFSTVALWLNVVFAALYAVSAAVTYSRLRADRL